MGQYQKNNELFHIALRYLSTAYIWGGNSPLSGFDCSGLVCEMLKIQGHLSSRMDLTAQGIFNYLSHRGWQETMVSVLGDIVFYGENSKKIRHCGMALNDTQLIEAGGGDSRTKTFKQAKEQNACVRIRAIEYRTDYLLCLTQS